MLKDKLMSHLAKKGKELDPLEKHAKVGIIRELSLQAGSMMGDKMKGLQKGVAPHDAELKHPAEKGMAGHTGSPADGSAAEEASESPAEEHAEELAMEGSPEEEASESPLAEAAEDVEAEHAHHSPEELDAKIQQLMALKHKKLAKA